MSLTYLFTLQNNNCARAKFMAPQTTQQRPCIIYGRDWQSCLCWQRPPLRPPPPNDDRLSISIYATTTHSSTTAQKLYSIYSMHRREKYQYHTDMVVSGTFIVKTMSKPHPQSLSTEHLSKPSQNHREFFSVYAIEAQSSHSTSIPQMTESIILRPRYNMYSVQMTDHKIQKSQKSKLCDYCPSDIDILTQQLEVEIYGWEDDIDLKTNWGVSPQRSVGYSYIITDYYLV